MYKKKIEMGINSIWMMMCLRPHPAVLALHNTNQSLLESNTHTHHSDGHTNTVVMERLQSHTALISGCGAEDHHRSVCYYCLSFTQFPPANIFFEFQLERWAQRWLFAQPPWLRRSRKEKGGDCEEKRQKRSLVLRKWRRGAAERTAEQVQEKELRCLSVCTKIDRATVSEWWKLRNETDRKRDSGRGIKKISEGGERPLCGWA